MSSKEPINSKREGSIDVNGEYLNYAVLQDDQFVIVQSSLFFYLEINTKDQEIISFPTDYNNLILYNAKSGEQEIGIPIPNLVGYCFSIVDFKKKSGDYKKIIQLLSFLTTVSLTQFIQEDSVKPIIEEKTPEPSFEDLIEGLLRVPPPKKKK